MCLELYNYVNYKMGWIKYIFKKKNVFCIIVFIEMELLCKFVFFVLFFFYVFKKNYDEYKFCLYYLEIG